MGTKAKFKRARHEIKDVAADLDAKVRKAIDFKWWQKVIGFFYPKYIEDRRAEKEALHESVLKSVKKKMARMMVYR